jgi:hypothetical protein
MIRNLKVLNAAAMALAAFGALSVSAHAADEFHCSVEPCTLTLAPDEASGTTTAHQVLVITGETTSGVKGASASFTCNTLSGEATVATKTSTDVTFKNLHYHNSAGATLCKIGAAETIKIETTSCSYTFKAAGGTTDGAEFHLLCNPGDGIDLYIGGTLCLVVTPFTATGIGYHDQDPANVKHEVLTTTVAAAGLQIPAAAMDLKNVGLCPVLGLKAIEEAKFTTANTIITGETETGIMANVWYT